MRPIECFSAILLAFLSLQNLQAQTLPTIAKAAYPSVVMISVADASGQFLRLGSGFFIRKDVVATTYSVIYGGISAAVVLGGGKANLQVEGLLAYSQPYDLALLKVKGTSTSMITQFDEQDPIIGKTIIAVANPTGLSGQYTTGIFVGSVEQNGAPLFQITAPLLPDCLGAPILDSKGKAIAMAIASLFRDKIAYFARPIGLVRSLLASSSGLQTLSALSSAEDPPVGYDAIGLPIADALKVEGVRWEYAEYDARFTGASYSFSFKNLLSSPISNIRYLVIFRDPSGNPVHFMEGMYRPKIQPGLAVFQDSSYALLGNMPPDPISSVRERATQIDIRIIGFSVE